VRTHLQRAVGSKTVDEAHDGANGDADGWGGIGPVDDAVDVVE
jgi:hypothetical protein